MNKNMRTISPLCGAFWVMFVVLLYIACTTRVNSGSALLTSLLFLGLALATTIPVITANKKTGMAVQELNASECINVSGDGKSITVNRRDPVCAKFIAFKKYSYRLTKYHDAELVYTGVTVGSVHTGGFHVNPAYESAGDHMTTEKYDMILVPYGVFITEINLTGEALEDAKKTPEIAKFLKGSVLELKHEVPLSQAEHNILRMHLLGQSGTVQEKTAGNYLENDIFAKSKLTLAECRMIKKWLSGI